MAAKHYSFPVVSGISARDPLSVRAARMHLYQQFISDLDSGGGKVSTQLSEVDISDPEDIWALLPAQGSDIQVHFGDSDFLARYRSYQPVSYTHLRSLMNCWYRCIRAARTCSGSLAEIPLTTGKE